MTIIINSFRKNCIDGSEKKRKILYRSSYPIDTSFTFDNYIFDDKISNFFKKNDKKNIKHKTRLSYDYLKGKY